MRIVKKSFKTFDGGPEILPLRVAASARV